MLRVAVLNSHPIQYFAPLYAHLHALGDLKLTVLYCSDSSLRGSFDSGFGRTVTWDVDLLSGYEHKFLGRSATTREPRGFWSLVCFELFREIKRDRYDALVVHGNQYAAYVLAAVLAKMRGIKLLNRCETTNQLVRTNVRRKLRNTVLRSYYRFFDAFLAIGTRNRQFYESVGVPSKKIFLAPYTVDNRRFISASAITSSQRSAIRQRFSLSVTVPVVLYASKLIERKHPDHVLRAAAALRQEGLEFQVLIVGTGAAEQGLKELARNLSLDNVVFAGFLNQSELPPVFAATDVFVLPSENEPWGLIVNEVMCAGRPVVASNSVGCAVDLIENGKNGYVIQPGNIDALKDALRMLIRDEKLRADMGRASQKRISSWDYEACARGVRSAVHFACDGPTSVRLGGLR